MEFLTNRVVSPPTCSKPPRGDSKTPLIRNSNEPCKRSFISQGRKESLTLPLTHGLGGHSVSSRIGIPEFCSRASLPSLAHLRALLTPYAHFLVTMSLLSTWRRVYSWLIVAQMAPTCTNQFGSFSDVWQPWSGTLMPKKTSGIANWLWQDLRFGNHIFFRRGIAAHTRCPKSIVPRVLPLHKQTKRYN